MQDQDCQKLIRKLRSFIAIDCPGSVKESLCQVQQELREVLEGWKLSWTRPEGIHLTLKFLGEVEEERLPLIAEALERAVAGTPPLQVRVRGVGVFPHLRSPRVVWVGMQTASEGLIHLQRRIEEVLVPLGFTTESRPFHPHLTLGRFKPQGKPRGGQGAGPVLERWIAQNEGRECGEFRAAEVLLMKSDLRPQGAAYTVLDRVGMSDG